MHRFVFSLVALMSLAAPAFAANYYPVEAQSASGSAITCTPMATTTSPPPYLQSHGKVYHRGTSTENIVLFCDVHLDTYTLFVNEYGSFQRADVFTIKYADPDAAGTQAEILAELKYADDAGNMHELATASSNAQGPGTGIRTMNADISWPSSGNGGHIYVQLTIKRTSASLLPAVYGYSLH